MRTSEVKANTMLERMGFRDNELGSPVHDDLTIALHQQLPPILRGYCITDRDGEKHYVKVLSSVVESPITKGLRQFKAIVGFVDLELTLEVPYKSSSGSTSNPTVSWETVRLLFEVKETIQIGPLLRQLQTYREFANCTESEKEGVAYFWVACPHATYSTLIQEQGFGFISLFNPLHIQIPADHDLRNFGF